MSAPSLGLPPEPPPPGAWAVLRGAALRLAALVVVSTFCAPLWLPYLLLAARYGRPPTLPAARTQLRWLGYALRRHPPLSRGVQLLVGLSMCARVAARPALGLAWLLDELLEGERLDGVTVVAPIFEVSAARSGSTQLAHTIEEDPRVIAPSLARCVLPYRWAWRLARRPWAQRHLVPRAEAAFMRLLPAEYIQRHELDLRRTDTFEVWLLGLHGGELLQHLGEATLTTEFGADHARPESAGLWEEDLPRFLHRLGQKVLLDVGATHGERRLMVKGHFLPSAGALAARFPDAFFLTMLRAPGPRLQSVLNFTRIQPGDPDLPPRPWLWIRHYTLFSQATYDEAERAWFTAPGGPARLAIPFSLFVNDLPGALMRVFGAIFGDRELAPHLPRSHPARERERYPINHSLAELGIDLSAVEAQSAAYLRWMRALEAEADRPPSAQPLAGSGHPPGAAAT